MSIEDTLNAACLALLGNATLTWAGGTAAGLFESSHIDPLGMAGTQPMIECATADVRLLAFDSPVTIQKTGSDTISQYTVAEVQPDGRGITRLFLK